MKQWISGLNIQNLKSFVNANLEFSKGINIVVGRNNSGKSTILQSILLLQQQSLCGNDCRKSSNAPFSISIQYDGNADFLNAYSPENRKTRFQCLDTNYFNIANYGGSYTSSWNPLFPQHEPSNLIYPYLSKRKVGEFQETINSQITSEVRGNLSNLYQKVDHISNAEMPAYPLYTKTCEEIIGFRITTIGSPNGKRAVLLINNFEYIPLSAMGEGVGNLLGLIVDLCVAEDKIFLIEEPENDIHPRALKGLLSLICEKASNNQFIITTHSNIVLKHLGAYPESKIFQVEMDFQNRLPTSSVRQIDQSPEAKREVLEDLGYELYDFDLWSGWLFLEESSAEKIIREYLIPWFTPRLRGKLRTFSARSRDEVSVKFDDFNRLFVFLHLEESYRNRVWVVIDDGDEEKKIINDFHMKYPQWDHNRFRTWAEHDFESYYPQKFQAKTKEVLAIESKQKKRTQKKLLLEEVEQWIKKDKTAAREAFQESAQSVIQLLYEIEEALCGPRKSDSA